MIYILLFILELIKYWLGFKLIFSAKIKINLYPFVALVGYAAIVFGFPLNSVDAHLLMYGIVIVLQFVTVHFEEDKRLFSILTLIFITICLDSVFEIILNIAILNKIILILSNSGTSLGSSMLTFIVFSVLFIGKRVWQLSIEKVAGVLDIRRMCIFLIVLSLEILLIIVSLNYAKSAINQPMFNLYVYILSLLSFVCLCFLVLFVLYIRKSNEKMKELLLAEQMLKEVQQNYYEALLEKEHETKRYRHDINNHLICLNQMVSGNKINQAQAYIENLQEKMQEIQSTLYHTGNEIMDMMLNAHLQSCRQEIQIEINGHFRQRLQISDTDLCTILSNCIQNAVEALVKVEVGKRFLRIDITQGNEYCKIQMENTIHGLPVFDEKGNLQTTKLNQKNHGLGVQNIKETIERNKGQFDIFVEKDRFIYSILLKNASFFDRSLS